MITRRHFLYGTGVLGAGSIVTGKAKSVRSPNSLRWSMPNEAGQHERTWMAFGASQQIWGRRLLAEVRRNLAVVANLIARYEPVTMLVRPHEMKLARIFLDRSVELVACPLDDLWIRDTGPTFVVSNQGHQAVIDFNFNGWGGKQVHFQDARVAAFMAKHARAPVLDTQLVLEGGSIEVDGEGTALITESSVLNENRNPGIAKTQFEELLMPLLGLEKIIWLPGIKDKDITDGHIDFYARFAKPGVVFVGDDPDPASYDHAVTQRHLEILASESDAKQRKLKVIPLQAPRTVRDKFETEDYAAGYIGYYHCNGAVIMQQFGDREADRAARTALQQVFPGRVIEQIAIDGIAAGGGSIHCATQQEPVGRTQLQSMLPTVS